MNNKTVKSYECKKCNKIVHFLPNETVYDTCKTCKQKMVFLYESKYNQKGGLSAVKSANRQTRAKIQAQQSQSTPTVTCPYCQSINTQKITATAKVINTALLGLFGTKRHKQWHCNSCGSDF